jgi:hypothetical protein
VDGKYELYGGMVRDIKSVRIKNLGAFGSTITFPDQESSPRNDTTALGEIA